MRKVLVLCIEKIWKGKFGDYYKRKNNIICRYYPSCSEYMIRSINKYGIIKGLVKGINRIRKCNNTNTDSCIDLP
jgi:Uncharacterized conserved protein